MANKKFYYDDPDGDALAKETCHPNFVKNMTSEFYYDCTDDYSPFGNDDGADLLYNLEEWYQEKEGKENIVKWLFNTIDEYGFKYQSEGCSKILEKSGLNQLEQEDPHFLSCMDNSIIAAAFGQYKISGELDKALKDVAMIAIKRQMMLNEESDSETVEEHNEYLKIMLNDLMRIE